MRQRSRAGAAAKSRGGSAGGDREGAGAGEISSRCETMPRAVADASDMASRIGQNTRRTIFFAADADRAPRTDTPNVFAATTRIERLLEDLFYLCVLYTSDYYSADAE
jgi:hypothetical protein